MERIPVGCMREEWGEEQASWMGRRRRRTDQYSASLAACSVGGLQRPAILMQKLFMERVVHVPPGAVLYTTRQKASVAKAMSAQAAPEFELGSFDVPSEAELP